MGDDLTTITVNAGIPTASISTVNTVLATVSANNMMGVNISFDMEEFLDRHSFNKFTVDHKVAEHEFLKLKEQVPTYADEIKENLSKNLARDIIKKATFTKKVDKDADVQHFIGRAWVFTEDELKNLINEARNA